MKYEFLVREVFRLADGVTVLACEGDASLELPVGSMVSLIADGDARQKIRLMGERLMRNQSARHEQRALETKDSVNLTNEETQSGRWRLIYES